MKQHGAGSRHSLSHRPSKGAFGPLDIGAWRHIRMQGSPFGSIACDAPDSGWGGSCIR